jgi:hypothetical protein
MAYAFSAFVGIDLIDFWPQEDRFIRALGFTHITVDAFIGDHQGHKNPSQGKKRISNYPRPHSNRTAHSARGCWHKTLH